MSDKAKTRPYWLLIAAAPVVQALLVAGSTYLDSRFTRGKVEWRQVIFYFLDWAFLAAVTPIIYALARRYPVTKDRLGRVIGVHSIGAVGLCFVWGSFGMVLLLILRRLPAQQDLFKNYLRQLLIILPWSIFLYFLLLGCVYAFTYYREARDRESQQARLSAQLAEAKLGALRMQLNPHFLFNSLNAITVLVRDHNTRDAAKMLELLSGILRQVLQGTKRTLISLAQELGFIEKYLAIEQVRFSDRLRVRWSVEESLRGALVPEFILQPLVENSIRHGIARCTEGGVIEITARESNGELVLSVSDNGPGYRPDPNIGVGLKNTKERLETLFGQTGYLEVRTTEGGGTVATVRFPLSRAKHE